MSCCGIIVLNAELKSMNSILTYESLFSRWVRARWRVEEIASSVERFGRYANWSGSSVLGRLVWCCAWLASQSTSLWLESVLWDGSHLDRTQVIFLVPVWLSWIWDMWGWLPGSARCWRYLLGHLSAVQHSLSVRGQVYCQGPAALRGLILDRVFLTSAGDRQSAWSLGGVGSFCADVLFCISNRE